MWNEGCKVRFLSVFSVHNLSFVRVYYDAGLNESYTNPGEWPWVVLIYHKEKYIGYKYKVVDFSKTNHSKISGAGAMLDNTVIVTTGY